MGPSQLTNLSVRTVHTLASVFVCVCGQSDDSSHYLSLFLSRAGLECVWVRYMFVYGIGPQVLVPTKWLRPNVVAVGRFDYGRRRRIRNCDDELRTHTREK